MKETLKTRVFIGGSVFLVLGLLLLVLFVDVLFPVKEGDVRDADASSRIGGGLPEVDGNESAPVVIVEFGDFQCPFCRKVLPFLKQVKAVYGDGVAFVYKTCPLASILRFAVRAAEASECARDQGAFWQYHDLLFENQGAFQDDKLVSYAAELGLDTTAFKDCLASGAKRLIIQRDFQEGLDLGLQGTPIFFINGQRLDGAQPYNAFKRIIDEELANYGKK